MTPLHIEIMLHYNCGASDYRDGDFSAPSVKQYIEELVDNGLLVRILKLNKYKITEKGIAYIEHLCRTPMPIQKWVMPEKVVSGE